MVKHNVLQELLAAAKNLAFPQLCFSCEKKINQGFVCTNCLDKIEFLYPPLCRYCAKPVFDNKTGLCRKCLNRDFPYDNIICTAVYKEPLISLIHSFKYTNIDYLDEFFSKIIAAHFAKISLDLSGFDFIIPVPMHPLKLKERGYNQSALLARFIANHFKIPLKDDIIYQVKNRISQTKLTKERREENIKDSFTVKEPIGSKRIILIDDIFTTGSTVRECAGVLKNFGASFITVITLAKTME